MKTAVAAVLLACLHGSAIAAPLERSSAENAVHQRDIAYGTSGAFIAESEVVNDALRQLAENPVIKRQIDGLLANKDATTRIALAIADSSQGSGIDSGDDDKSSQSSSSSSSSSSSHSSSSSRSSSSSQSGSSNSGSSNSGSSNSGNAYSYSYSYTLPATTYSYSIPASTNGPNSE